MECQTRTFVTKHLQQKNGYSWCVVVDEKPGEFYTYIKHFRDGNEQPRSRPARPAGGAVGVSIGADYPAHSQLRRNPFETNCGEL